MKPIDKINHLVAAQKALNERVDQMSIQIDEIKRDHKNTGPGDMEDTVREIDQRKYKKKNLVISGLPSDCS